MAVVVRQLTSKDVTLMEAVSTMFGEAFGDEETHSGARLSRGVQLV